MSHLSTLLADVLRDASIDSVFQPIYDLRGLRPRIHLVESLSRIPHFHDAGGPCVLFAYARRRGLEPALDRVCAAGGVQRIASFADPPRVSVNVHASTLSRDSGFIPFLVEICERSGYPTDRLVIEVIEHAPAWTRGHFAAALDKARLAGMGIALDDVGEAQSNYRMILEVEAEYLKLDAYFVAGCHRDRRRRAIIASLTQLAGSLGALVVAEGLERIEDLWIVRELGVSHA